MRKILLLLALSFNAHAEFAAPAVRQCMVEKMSHPAIPLPPISAAIYCSCFVEQLNDRITDAEASNGLTPAVEAKMRAAAVFCTDRLVADMEQ